MRLTKEFVSTSLGRLRGPPEPEAVETLIASLQNLRHVRAGLGEPLLALSIIGAENSQSNAPQWFRALIRTPTEVAAIPVRLSDGRSESIVVVADPADEIDEVWEGVRDHALVGATIAIVALLVTSLLVGRAVKPIGVASTTLARLKAGDYGARAEAGGPPEIRDLNANINNLAETLGDLKRDNKELAERVFAAHDEERQVIAHELHDEFGPHLFGLRASAAALTKKVGDNPAARAAASAIEAQVEALQGQNRRILADLRPAALEELGLAEALEALVAHWRRAESRVAVTLDVDRRVEAMSERASLMAYRFVQEAMTNAFRHAGATRIDVSLRFETAVLGQRQDDGGLAGLVIRVADDGRGLQGEIEAGMGLAGMRDRVRLLGGRVTIRSPPMGGVVIDARFGAPQSGKSPTGSRN